VETTVANSPCRFGRGDASQFIRWYDRPVRPHAIEGVRSIDREHHRVAQISSHTRHRLTTVIRGDATDHDARTLFGTKPSIQIGLAVKAELTLLPTTRLGSTSSKYCLNAFPLDVGWSGETGFVESCRTNTMGTAAR